MATNLISSVSPLVSPGYFRLFLFLLLIVENGRAALLLVDEITDSEEEHEIGPHPCPGFLGFMLIGEIGRWNWRGKGR